jgi:hypothetical protein
MLLCESKCYARIGETLEQCEKRYGKRITDKRELLWYANWLLLRIVYDGKGYEGNGEVKEGSRTYYFFRLDKYVICLKLDKEKVDEIIFSKFEKYDSQPSDMSRKEIDVIVGANTKEIKCNYLANFKMLIIRTEEYKMKLDKENEDAKKEQDDKEKNVLKKF